MMRRIVLTRVRDCSDQLDVTGTLLDDLCVYVRVCQNQDTSVVKFSLGGRW